MFLVVFGQRTVVYETSAFHLLLFYTLQLNIPCSHPQYTPKPFADGPCTWQAPFLVGHLPNFSGQQISMASVENPWFHALPCPSVPCLPSRCPAGECDACLPLSMFVMQTQVCWFLLAHLATLGEGRRTGRGGGNPMNPPLGCHWGLVCQVGLMMVVGPFKTEEHSVAVLGGSFSECGNTYHL